MNESGSNSEINYRSVVEKPHVISPEQLSFYKDRHFFFLHGNLQRKLPKWTTQFGEYLANIGVPINQIHTPHLKHPFADYRSWRKDSNLPNLSENMFSSLPDEAKQDTLDHHKVDLARDSTKAIVIGHSSGSQVALAYAEHHRIDGLVLLAPTDKANTGGVLGALFTPIELASGMYTRSGKNRKGIIGRVNREPNWDRIVRNSRFIVVVHATGDTSIPEINSRNVYDKLKEAAEKLDDNEIKQDSSKVIYLNLQGKGHEPEPGQFGQIMTNIPTPASI